MLGCRRVDPLVLRRYASALRRADARASHGAARSGAAHGGRARHHHRARPIECVHASRKASRCRVAPRSPSRDLHALHLERRQHATGCKARLVPGPGRAQGCGPRRRQGTVRRRDQGARARQRVAGRRRGTDGTSLLARSHLGGDRARARRSDAAGGRARRRLGRWDAGAASGAASEERDVPRPQREDGGGGSRAAREGAKRYASVSGDVHRASRLKTARSTRSRRCSTSS